MPVVSHLEPRTGERRDDLGDRLRGKLSDPEADDVRPGSGADQGELRPLALDDAA